MTKDVFRGLGVEITLKEDDDFLKVKETLTRIGIASKKDNKLYQSCHILHKQERYAIVHFKEMFILDGKDSDMSYEDEQRRDAIAYLLEDWNLLKIVPPKPKKEPFANIGSIKIIPFKDKANWELVQKYSIGNKK